MAAKAAIDINANNFDNYLVSGVYYILVTTALLNSNVCDRVLADLGGINTILHGYSVHQIPLP